LCNDSPDRNDTILFEFDFFEQDFLGGHQS